MKRSHVASLQGLRTESTVSSDTVRLLASETGIRTFDSICGTKQRNLLFPENPNKQRESTERRATPEDSYVIYRVAQKSKPLSLIIIKSYLNPPLWLDFESFRRQNEHKNIISLH